MAITKIWKIDQRMDKVINYATDEKKTDKKLYKENEDFYDIGMALNYAINPGKTEELFYTTGINCEVETATKKMLETKINLIRKKVFKDFMQCNLLRQEN